MSDRLGVIGAGYLGATHAACLAELGYDVLVADIDPARVAALGAGQLPFFEPQLANLLRRHVTSGRLRFTTAARELAAHADVHFICVGTPQRRDGLAADTRYVFSAAAAVVPHLRRSALVVGKSTVPVGTAAQLAELCQRLAPAGVSVEVAWNPEFTREGHAVTDTLFPDRLVFGVTSVAAEKRLREIYGKLVDAGVPVVVTDTPTSELAKVAANAYLATKISFANALAELCEAAGADVQTLTAALGLDERIGGRFLDAGLGFGGGCLPKDVRALMATAADLESEEAFELLRVVDEINARRRRKVVGIAVEECGGSVLGCRVAVLGVAFKPDTDDVRDSPALDVAARLHEAGAHVVVYDPRANATAAKVRPDLSYVDEAWLAVEGAHLVLHLTEWPEFGSLDPLLLHPLAAVPRIVDARNTLNGGLWLEAGWSFRAMGRGVAPARDGNPVQIKTPNRRVRGLPMS